MSISEITKKTQTITDINNNYNPFYQSINQSINQSKHICTAPYVTNESFFLCSLLDTVWIKNTEIAHTSEIHR